MPSQCKPPAPQRGKHQEQQSPVATLAALTPPARAPPKCGCFGQTERNRSEVEHGIVGRGELEQGAPQPQPQPLTRDHQHGRDVTMETATPRGVLNDWPGVGVPSARDLRWEWEVRHQPPELPALPLAEAQKPPKLSTAVM